MQKKKRIHNFFCVFIINIEIRQLPIWVFFLLETTRFLWLLQLSPLSVKLFELPPLLSFWHQAVASMFSAVCALNRLYQDQTIVGGSLSQHLLNGKKKKRMFQIINLKSTHLNKEIPCDTGDNELPRPLCIATLHAAWTPKCKGCSSVTPRPPATQVRFTINICGGNLQKRQNFVFNHRWRIIYTEKETHAQRYSIPSTSVFNDLNLAYTKICLGKEETSCQGSSGRSA